MSQSNKVLISTLVASCLALAACGSNSSSSPQSSTSSAALVEATKAAAAVTASVDGTTIPSATQIVDASANVWTVSSGVIKKNGAAPGYTNAVTLLLYDNAVIYQQNKPGNWWSWNGSAWTSTTDPRKVPSPSGATMSATGQLTDGTGNVWALAAGTVYENGVLAGYSKGVTRLVYDNSKIYQENAAGGWWSWSGGTWTSSTDPISVSPPGVLTIGGNPSTTDTVGGAYSFIPTTTNTGGGTLSFSITNIPSWASFSTVTGALTGTPGNGQAGTRSNILISVGNGTESATLAAFSITVAMGSASMSWTAPTENTNGTALTDLAGYTIYYGTSSGALTDSIQVANASAIGYVVGNLNSGTYYFEVSAYTTAGTQSARSSMGSKTII